MDVEDALEEVGSWGRYQITLYILIIISAMPNAFFSLQYAFVHYEPSHHCKFTEYPASIALNTTNELNSFLDFAIPNETNAVGKVTRSSCTMYGRNYSAYPSEDWTKHFNSSDEKIKCNDGWVFDFEPHQKTVVSEFSLVCDDDWKPPFVVSLSMAGKLLGSLFVLFADRYGRKPIFLISSVMQVLSMVFAAFSWNFASYTVAAFVGGCATLVNYVSAFVLATEMTGVNWRNFFGMSATVAFSIGYSILPFVAYFFQDWRKFLLVVAAITGGLYLPNFWLFPESAVWLIQKGRAEHGLKELKRISRMNGKERHFNAMLEAKGNIIVSKGVSRTGIKETLLVLFRSGVAPRYLTVIFSWFACGLVYYGISLYSTSFSDDRFLNVLYAGLGEIPALLFGYYMMKFVGRPRTLFLFMLISAISNFILPLLREDASVLKTLMAVLGKGAVSAAYYVVFLLTSELAPTLQRGACMGLSSGSARLASAIVPFVMYTRKIHPFIPNGILAAIGFTSAFLVLFYVPETKGLRMPDSIEEAKSNTRIYGLKIFRNFAPAKASGKRSDVRHQEALL